MSQIHHVHMCISVRGVLCKSDRELETEFRDAVTDDNGRKCTTAKQIRNVFFDELAKGHEYVPLGNCDNFDYKAGCRGHVSEEPAETDEETHSGPGRETIAPDC